MIPRLTLPLSTNHPSREPPPLQVSPLHSLSPSFATTTNHSATAAELYDDLSTRARGASEEVLAFNSLFVKSQPIFDYADASRARNPRAIQSVSVYDMFYTDEEGAVEEVKEEEEDTVMKEGEEGEDEEEEEVVEETREEDVGRVVEEFREGAKEMKVDVEVGDAGRVVKVGCP